MPTYNLTYDSGSTADCGRIVIAKPQNVVTISHIPPGGSQPTQIQGATYTPKAGGNGTWNNPAVGDTLYLADSSFDDSQGNSHTFSGNAEFESGTPGKYHHAGDSVRAALGDWDAADSGGGVDA